MALRQARLFDGTVPGGQGRPEVPTAETEALLAYLNGAPIVLAARGFDRDVIDPEGPRNVPLTFHTDGAWIWPGSVAYYLRVHGVPPEPALVDHARTRGFEVPEVPEDVRSAAVSTVTGSAPPRPSTGQAPPAPPAAESTPPAQASTEPVPPAQASAGHAPPQAGHAPPSAGQAPPSAGPGAARHASPPADSGGPIEPLPGEPPRTLYQGLAETVLPPGTEVDRLGGPEGNVTYAAGTEFGRRSLPPDWASRPRRVYRVTRPVRALTGTAIPWFGQPGGGTVHILPAAVAALLADGTLAELPAPR